MCHPFRLLNNHPSTKISLETFEESEEIAIKTAIKQFIKMAVKTVCASTLHC